jgi:hypothetical protein
METLKMASELCLPMEPKRGLNRANRIIRVSPTAIWATTRLPFLNQGVKINNTKPEITGIRAVAECVSEPKYPQVPIIIKTTAFTRFIEYGFMSAFLGLYILCYQYKNNRHNNLFTLFLKNKIYSQNKEKETNQVVYSEIFGFEYNNSENGEDNQCDYFLNNL